MPQIASQVLIAKTPEVVWDSFKDVRFVAECMPGVELKEQKDENTFTGSLRSKIGAISTNFEGQAMIVQRDDEARTGKIEAKGVDRRGGSRASATVSYQVIAVDAGSSVDIVADIKLQGVLAQFGRSGILQDISDQLIQEFADTLQKRLSAESPEAAAQIKPRDVRPVALFFRTLWMRIKRLFGGKGTGAAKT